MLYTSIMHPIGILAIQAIGLIFFEALVVWMLVAPRRFFLKLRCRRAFRRWTEKNGFEVVSEETRGIGKGPFQWGFREDYEVTRLEVRDRDGKVRTGYIRCGNHAKGFLGQHDVGVCWEPAVE